MPDQLLWFALRTKPRHEKSVAGLLDFTGHESFLPLYSKRQRWSQRWQEVSSPLFAGYVFSRFDRSSWSQVMRIPGVIDAVRFGNALAGIEDSEIKALQLVQRAESPVQPCAYLPTGQMVRVADGPLTGLTGVVCEDDGRAQIVLSVTMLQRSVRVQIDREKIVCAADLDSAYPNHHASKQLAQNGQVEAARITDFVSRHERPLCASKAGNLHV